MTASGLRLRSWKRFIDYIPAQFSVPATPSRVKGMQKSPNLPTSSGYANLRDRLSYAKVSGMGKQVAAITSGCAKASSAGDAAQCMGMAWGVFADELLRERPSRFDVARLHWMKSR
jgi:hypothetical protein